MNPVEVLQFVGIPVIAAAVIVICSWWLLPAKRLQPVGAILAVGAASCIAFILQEGVPSIPPMQKWHWLVLTVFLVSVLACLSPLCRKFDKRVILQAMIAGIIAAIFMQFPSQSNLFVRFIIFLMVLFVSIGLRRFTIPPWHMYVVAWLVLAGISIMALQSSFAKLAFYAGAMSAVAASMCVLQLIKTRETKSIQMIFGVLIVGCSLCGFSYNQNGGVFALLWFAPMAAASISSIAYLLLKHHKNRAFISLAIAASCIAVSTIWSILVSLPADDMWP